MGFLQSAKEMAAKALGVPTDFTSIGKGVFNLIQQQGGIEGIKAKFDQEGFGNIVKSWISTGANQPITAEQLQKVFGNETLKNLAQKAGIPQEQIGQKLAEYLPKIIDKLTPGGTIPSKLDSSALKH